MCNHAEARGACNDLIFFVSLISRRAGRFGRRNWPSMLLFSRTGRKVGSRLDYTTALALCARDLP